MTQASRKLLFWGKGFWACISRWLGARLLVVFTVIAHMTLAAQSPVPQPSATPTAMSTPNIRVPLSHGAGFEAANKLYEEWKFREAAEEYAGLIEAGQRSAAIYFNWGNALFKSGQLGRALAAYRQAERLSPRDPDVRANLQFTRNQARGPTAPEAKWQRWLNQITINEWTAATSALLWLVLIALSLGQWKPAWRRNLRGWLITLSLSLVVCVACLAMAWQLNRATRLAIVVVPEAEAKHGPLEESQAAFTAHDGSELLLLDEKDQWIQVSAGPRRVGWVKRDQVILLRQG
jgi:tetratricopeptide (TPR) repeat protein